MGNDYLSLDELRYYRNILTINVGDTVEWCINVTSHNHHQCRMVNGVITAIYPEGKGSYIGKQNAFMTVFSPPQNYSVSLTNPTIRKLETDK